MEDSLVLTLLQRIAFIAVIAYVFSQSSAFRSLFTEQTTPKEEVILIGIFSLISIAGTYIGVPVEGAIVNVRDTGTIVAGLLGGPVIGTATGLISGLHRISLGGFTAIQCGISTIAGGILAGFIHSKMKPKSPEFITGIITGIGVVLFSMALIIISATPNDAAISLVYQATVPMCMANALGIGVFIIIIHNAREYQTRIGALETNKAFSIANATLPYFRLGLSKSSAEEVAKAIQTMTSAAAVAITNCEKILAHVGLGSDHHKSGSIYLTSLTKACLSRGQTVIALTAENIGCSCPGCRLKSAVVVPLYCQDELVGCLKIYYAKEEAVSKIDIEFAQGLAQIFGTQLELAKYQNTKELATKAELKALRAQVNPHFLFNALNTIVSLCRTNPEQARHLIIELSEFFRRSLKASPDFVSINEELEHVDSYLSLEKARYGDRLNIIKDIDCYLDNIKIPCFTLQPLVENAIKHGLSHTHMGGTVIIDIKKYENYVAIMVKDNGQGIPADRLKEIFCSTPATGNGIGIGLTNVNERLKNIYGLKHCLKISSSLGEGTCVSFTIPLQFEDVNECIVNR